MQSEKWLESSYCVNGENPFNPIKAFLSTLLVETVLVSGRGGKSLHINTGCTTPLVSPKLVKWDEQYQGRVDEKEFRCKKVPVQ